VTQLWGADEDHEVELLVAAGLGLDHETVRFERVTEEWLAAGSALRDQLAAQLGPLVEDRVDDHRVDLRSPAPVAVAGERHELRLDLGELGGRVDGVG